jgi:hypothetical protein
MKLNIVVDNTGTVVGTFRQVQENRGVQIRAGVNPSFGHSIHQIDVDDSVLKQPGTRFHEEVQKLANTQLGKDFHLKG